MEISREAKTNIWSDVREGDEDKASISININVDHLDENAPFEVDLQEISSGEWLSLNEMLELKKMINKAIRIHKAGFKV